LVEEPEKLKINLLHPCFYLKKVSISHTRKTVISYHHNLEVGRILHDTSTLRAKGWSNSKIERWLEDKSKKENLSFEEAIDGVELWKSITGELLSLAGVRSVGLLLHNYEGSVVEEEFTVKRRTVNEIEFDASLDCFNENQLLMTTKHYKKSQFS
jgi:hypothetical protein